MTKSLKIKTDIDMCSRPLLGKIVKFSLPLIATGVLQLLYNAADIIVVGRFASADAMAAVGSTGALINLIINVFVGLSIGALSATARAIGANDRDGAEKIVHTSMLISLIGGILFGIFGFFASEYLLNLMHTPASILPLSAIYLKIYFVGLPFNAIYNFGSSVLRACGDTKNPLIFLTISGIINVVLNLIFVIVFKMSVAGVAVSTIISQAISAVLIVICLMRRNGYGKLEFKKLRINKRALLIILRIGLPAGIQSTIFSLSNVIIQSSINSVGNIAMAGNSSAANLEGFAYISMNAISQACLTFTGQNFGANNKKNCSLVLMQTLILTTIIGLIVGCGLYFASPLLLRLYNTDPTVIAYGIERLKIIGTTYFLCGIMEVLVGAMRGVGKSMLPMLISIFGVCAIRIIWIYTVFKKTNNLIMLYMSYPVSWLITCIILVVFLIFAQRRAFAKINANKPKIDNTLV
ncbi:MAG: MATE family efflux transporter [Clostridia bacterium]